MQEKNKNINVNLIIFFAVTLLFTVLRSVLLIFNFDFESGFFYNKAFATALYISSLVFCAVLLFVFKSANSNVEVKKDSKFVLLLNLVLCAVFVGLFITSAFSIGGNTKFELFAKYFSLITLTLSAFFYFANSLLMSKVPLKIIQLLNLFPVLYLIFEIIAQFMEISGRATTYNRFPNVFSLIILALFVLKVGKSTISNSSTSLFSISCITFFALTFSLVPDLVTLCTDDILFNAKEIFVLLLKALYVLISAKFIFDLSRKTKEEV